MILPLLALPAPLPSLAALLAPLQEGPSEPAQPGLFGSSFVPIVLMIGIFYIILIRPERKKQKQRREMLSTLQKGDRVMTSSGMFGDVMSVKKDLVVLKVADGVKIEFSRAAVQEIVRETPRPDESEVEVTPEPRKEDSQSASSGKRASRSS